MPRGPSRFGDGGNWKPADATTTSLERPSASGTSMTPDTWSGVTAGDGSLWNTWGGLWADPQPRMGTAAIRHPDTGELMYVTYEWFRENGILPAGLTRYEFDQMNATGTLQGDLDAWWGANVTGGSGSGRGGGGAVGPVYAKPDERLVRESVKGMLASLAGTVDEGKLEELTALYMDEHKRSFSVRETEQIDPMESVKAAIRDMGEYKAIHQLRPESTDEYTWITERQGALKRAGVTDIVSESLGIAQATAGSSTQEATTAGNIATFSQSGQQLDELKGRIRTATYGALQLA